MKVEEKRKLKKIAIIEAALDVWSVDDYRTTSLNALATNLNMTKQALYRYFKNKEDLLDSMTDYVSSLENLWFQDMTRKLKAVPQEEKIRFFISNLSQALTQGRRYLHFDSFNTLRLDKLSLGKNMKNLEEIRDTLDVPEKVIHLIMMFCFFLWGWQETQHIQKKRNTSQKIELIIEVIENGLATEKFRLPEKGCSFQDTMEYRSFRVRLNQENLIQAVTQVIQEKGFQGVTLELIAEKAGISKSTLYNYFKNKDDMLTQTTNLLVKEYMQYHSQLLSTRDCFEDKLLAHLEMQCLLFPKKPQAFIIIKQFMSRDVFDKVEKPALQPGFLDFLEDGIKEKKLKPLLSVYEYQMVFSFFIFIERVILRNEDELFLTRKIIDWLGFLAYGFKYNC
ncbi:TetR/AcrR family transcriptional regulator [Oceanispirochaeta sp.]|jgi:AcrR family transcriptional regulator|uniref:TetR/AcrR family transcriptional regulator n=1 Tax=Oceanispirochaeta sp. TaxID=2035350 RepID=UPI002635F3C2|nr:TetR/AcrR family transcriptional regulator [Oceanispirochaeta sp.]MDA3959012.1 TetR/AcrR family transcriptional regulator [Oceanispirochaeta sp.]